jgi:hypothetical protein
VEICICKSFEILFPLDHHHDLRIQADLMLRSPKRELPTDMGFVAYFTDTEKNVLGLWSMK